MPRAAQGRVTPPTNEDRRDTRGQKVEHRWTAGAKRRRALTQ